MGADDILLVSDSYEYLSVPSRAEVMSTIGVGDSAVAGFLSGLADGKELMKCLAYASRQPQKRRPSCTRKRHWQKKKDSKRMLPQVELSLPPTQNREIIVRDLHR